jgi:hypothetical protein
VVADLAAGGTGRVPPGVAGVKASMVTVADQAPRRHLAFTSQPHRMRFSHLDPRSTEVNTSAAAAWL